MVNPYLQLGSSCYEVKEVQVALNVDAKNRGLPHRQGIVPLTVDGRFGPNTQTRLIEFQNKQFPPIKPAGAVGPVTWAALRPLVNEGSAMYEVPSVTQGSNPICWVSCMAMVASEREQTSIGVGAFTGGFDPNSASIPNPAHSYSDFVARLNRCGFTSITLGNDPTDILVALRDYGPLILSHYCHGFPYGSRWKPITDPTAMHAVVITAITLQSGYNGNCFINNPWDGYDIVVSCNAVLRAISKVQGKGMKAIAYYR